jgi:hypothetical protein
LKKGAPLVTFFQVLPSTPSLFLLTFHFLLVRGKPSYDKTVGVTPAEEGFY